MSDPTEVIVRELERDDWPRLRDLRLHALATEIGRFFRHPDDEVGLGDDVWMALATPDDAHCLFGCFDGESLIGISAVRQTDDDPAGRTAMFGMTYVLPAYRRLGLAKRLFDARLAWVRANPRFERAVVGHRRSNEASRRNIERAGFVRTGAIPHRWPDGIDEDDVVYELPLRDLDPTCVASHCYRVAFENERVRVLTFRAQPGERWAVHTHPDSVVISLSDYTVGNHVAGSSPTRRVARRGESKWIPAVTHSGENLGETVMECVLVELKDAESVSSTQPSSR